MPEISGSRRTAMELLERMFEVEMRFVKSDANDLDQLADAFHPDVVITSQARFPMRAIGLASKGSAPCFEGCGISGAT